MDAHYSGLPVPAREYFDWLKGSHFSANWLCFEVALEALELYEFAQAAAESCRSIFETFESLYNEAGVGTRTSARNKLFVAQAKQIIAQEELSEAVTRCGDYCTESAASSDVCRLFYWLQAQAADAEEAVAALLGTKRGRKDPLTRK